MVVLFSPWGFEEIRSFIEYVMNLSTLYIDTSAGRWNSKMCQEGGHSYKNVLFFDIVNIVIIVLSLYGWPPLGMILYIYYFICSDIFIYISINTKYKCWWLVRFEDVYKFIRGHRLSLGGSPRSPPFYFPIFIEPMNCFPRSQSQIFLEYWESMYHNISLYFPSLLNPWIVFQQVNHRYF